MIYQSFPTILTGTITGLRISNASGVYFLDNLPAAILQQAGSGNELHLYDGSKWKKMTLGAKGTAETLDTEIATGTCVAGKLYKITATEVNHYGTGLVVGNYFTSTGTETNDANNKVQQVLTTSSSGCLFIPVSEEASFNPNATTFTYRLLCRRRVSGGGSYIV